MIHPTCRVPYVNAPQAPLKDLDDSLMLEMCIMGSPSRQSREYPISSPLSFAAHSQSPCCLSEHSKVTAIVPAGSLTMRDGWAAGSTRLQPTRIPTANIRHLQLASAVSLISLFRGNSARPYLATSVSSSCNLFLFAANGAFLP